MKACLIVACLIAAAYGQAQAAFQATIIEYNNPLIIGSMLGTIYYDSTNGLMRTDYQVGTGIVSELIDYTKKFRYLHCTACQAESWSTAIPQYFGGNPTGGSLVINGQTCSHYSVVGNQVTDIWANGATICRAVWGTGRTVDFTNVTPGAPATAFAIVNTWNCPAPVCNKQIDFVLVFDESGSISAPNFVKEVQFGTSFAQSYSFGPTQVGMSLVQFSTAARLTIHMTYSQTSFLNAMNKVFQNPGNTCIGCGISIAHSEFINFGRWKTPGVAYVIIMLTDGMNNVGLNQFDQIVASAKADNILIFALGVGALVNQQQLVQLASVLPGVTTAYPAIPSFTALQGVLNGLVAATCQAIAGNPCGTGCNGFCSCGATCVCPSTCDDHNQCTNKMCNPAQNGAGCLYSPKPCSNGNLCQTGTCNPATGCSYTNITCAAVDACHTAACDPAVGCTNAPVNCQKGNPCYLDTCDPALTPACQHTLLPPGSCNMCINVTCPTVVCANNICDPKTGLCNAQPINCDDNNKCTDDSCNPTTGMCQYVKHNCDNGNNCQIHTCDPQTGCIQTDVNVTAYCNDFSDCTIDTCVPATGCVHTNVTCFDNNTCTADFCKSVGGCYFPPIDCLTQPRIAHLIGTCYEALCNTSRGGCYLNPLPGAVIDRCGVCNGNNLCSVIQLPSNTAVAVAGGLLGVLIVGGVIIGAALISFAGKKGYDIWLAHRGAMQGASSNPLYNDNGLTGVNPTYSANA